MTTVATLPEESGGPWSIKTRGLQKQHFCSTAVRQKDAERGGDDILFSHHCHHCVSAQPRVTARRELQGGIQFKLHIYWLPSQPLCEHHLLQIPDLLMIFFFPSPSLTL